MPLSDRLRRLVDELPLSPGMRVLEIGCGPGAAAREVVRRVGPDGHVHATDRSATAVRQAETAGAEEMAAGRLSVRRVAAEDLGLMPGQQPFDLVFAIRVGALDGRHPRAGRLARARIARVLRPGGSLHVELDGAMRVVELPDPETTDEC